MKLSVFLKCAFASSFAALLGACSAPTHQMEEIQYLDGILPMSQRMDPQMAMDTESYWDGDHVTGSPSITLDISDQKAYFYKGGTLVGVSRMSTGTPSHPTPTGNYKITQKSRDHRSSHYGDFVDGAGNVVVRDIDKRKDKAPPGTRYLGASMEYFLRFNQGIGMHAGFLPGYPASHGCVRLPEHMAQKFYEHSPLGTPVKVVP